MSSRQALGTQGDGGDEQQLPPTLPALIILKRTRTHTRLLVGQQQKNLSMRSAHKCGADQISAFFGTERSHSAAHLQMAQTVPGSQSVANSAINPLEFAPSVRNCPQTLWIKGSRRGSGTTEQALTYLNIFLRHAGNRFRDFTSQTNMSTYFFALRIKCECRDLPIGARCYPPLSSQRWDLT